MTERAIWSMAILWGLAVACGDDETGDMSGDEPPADLGASDLGATLDMGLPLDTCATEGAMRTGVCGNCGTAQEVCTDGVWTLTGPCLNEAECAPGSLETEATPMCGERARICSDSCVWSGWDAIEPDGECIPGDEREVECGLTTIRVDTCSDACWWVEGECLSPCGALRTLPESAREVCAPGGPFMRGDPVRDGPVAEIHLSTFAIDVHPVTIARYRTCVEAAACPYPADTWRNDINWNPEHYDTAPDDAVMWALHSEAEAFCAWDGGRRLPTDAEWQKAMRGPSPRTHATVFGEMWDCSAIPLLACEGVAACDWNEQRTGAYPAVQSYYGLEDHRVAWERTSDFYDSEYYQSPSSLVDDPLGPTDGLYRVIHGARCSGTLGEGRIGDRTRTSSPGQWIAFRCARTIEE